jgi:hypothetical protein
MTGRLFGTAALLIAAGAAMADPPRGYWVNSSGYYDQFPYPPAYAGRFQYSTDRPTVLVQDPTGAVVSMPLRPKVLYYSKSLVTPEGYYYPTSITVIPDDRRPIIRTQPRMLPSIGSTYRYDGGPVSPIPPVSNGRSRNR